MNFSRKNNRPDIYALIALLTLMLIYICSFVDRQIIAVLASQIRVDLNFTNTQMGVLYGPAFLWFTLSVEYLWEGWQTAFQENISF